MASVLMRVPLGDGSGEFMVAEVDAQELDSVELVAHDSDGRIVQAAHSLAEAFNRIEPALGMIVTRLRDAARAPDEISVGFGLKLGGETGLIFAKGKAETSFTVTVTWTKQPDETLSTAATGGDEEDEPDPS
ncbi:CU044_2847 family protein [Actinocorallia longicatena]|uniref:Trypsin-co-occurring domain-containing protein n=1 Tax=Actinocorallia longicatena TaxID=111803 RepID=A0ABP6QMR6_9ACTN